MFSRADDGSHERLLQMSLKQMETPLSYSAASEITATGEHMYGPISRVSVY